ncbi:dual specificity protein phosphatase 16-like [Dendronephthya gigantea]|uniref:dual specificity protein phosphatase 16-like n=1 Tax=Dendronephthya gigantea TaxID=151771 RepID=UPI00106C2868|nr:dual specificity protein phosphatase 16-like [Dendronephthya gigantea]
MGSTYSSRKRVQDRSAGDISTQQRYVDRELSSDSSQVEKNSLNNHSRHLSVEKSEGKSVSCTLRRNSKHSQQNIEILQDPTSSEYSENDFNLGGDSAVGDKLCHYTRDSTIPAYFEKQFNRFPEEDKNHVYLENIEDNFNQNLPDQTDSATVSSHRREHLSTSEVISLRTGEELDLMTVHELYNCLNDGTVNAYIMDPFYILILDIRDRSEYDVSHIVTAQPSDVIYTELVLLFNYGYIGGRTSLRDFTMVVIYGNGPCNLDDSSCPELKLYHELQGFGIQPSILKGGFESFKEKYPFLCSSIHITDEEERKKYLQTYPSEIVEGKLYQGRGDQATNKTVIRNLKITHIVNVCTEHPNAFPEEITYLNINVEDLNSSCLKLYFEKSSNFIKNAFDEDGCVLVHCNLGMSRSSTMSLCYLMKSRHWSLKEAYDFMKSKRQAVKPNRSFLKQLCELEIQLLGKKVTDADDIWF